MNISPDRESPIRIELLAAKPLQKIEIDRTITLIPRTNKR